ncbi:MAG: ectoine synthase [Xanthomonadales bacterium]|jgi:L-ectoine synthase|nr:ectoine synthase [Xanthomonadales bacterium]
MILRTLASTLGTDREVDAATWTSRRLLLKDDRMGFSLHDTLIKAGTETPMWYQNHLEAVYCIAGEGEIETLDDGKRYPIGPGTVYALDRHDRHVLRARTELRMVCVFNPPLTGKETHNASGTYPTEDEMLALAS